MAFPESRTETLRITFISFERMRLQCSGSSGTSGGDMDRLRRGRGVGRARQNILLVVVVLGTFRSLGLIGHISYRSGSTSRSTVDRDLHHLDPLPAAYGVICCAGYVHQVQDPSEKTLCYRR